MPKPQKNSPLRIGADEWGDLLEIRKDWKIGRLNNSPGRFNTGNNNQVSGVVRGIDGLRAGSVVGFGPDPAHIVTESDKLNPLVEFKLPTADHISNKTAGFLIGPAQKKGFAKAKAPGFVAFARVDFTDAAHTHANFKSNQGDAVSGGSGYLILAATGDDGNQLGSISGLANAIVYVVSGFEIRVRLCVVNNDIIADSSGAVTIWDDSVSPPVATTEVVANVVLDWMHGGKKVSQGKKAAFIDFGDIKRLMWAECE